MRGLRLALSTFTLLPVGAPEADRRDFAAALRWLPTVGLVLGAVSGSVALVAWRGHGAGSPLLGAVLAVAALALLTRGLHLDGLADLADGLGSRRPAGEALEIMRRSDIGPFGVATLVLVPLIDIAAVATVFADDGRGPGWAQWALAAVVGRVAVLLAAGPAMPAARSGFGELVAGSAGAATRAVAVVVVLALAAAAGSWAGSAADAGRVLGAVVVALLAADLTRRHAVRRLGGVTGDVFGALVEIATASYLLVLAVLTVWR